MRKSGYESHAAYIAVCDMENHSRKHKSEKATLSLKYDRGGGNTRHDSTPAWFQFSAGRAKGRRNVKSTSHIGFLFMFTNLSIFI